MYSYFLFLFIFSLVLFLKFISFFFFLSGYKVTRMTDVNVALVFLSSVIKSPSLLKIW
jgi:hypothetical protein